jgi:hypothetical protein
VAANVLQVTSISVASNDQYKVSIDENIICNRNNDLPRLRVATHDSISLSYFEIALASKRLILYTELYDFAGILLQ